MEEGRKHDQLIKMYYGRFKSREKQKECLEKARRTLCFDEAKKS